MRGAPSTVSTAPLASANRAATPAVVATRLAHALDALLEEGLTRYDDHSAAGRRRMKELNSGFAAGEIALARARVRGAAALSPVVRLRLLADAVGCILHWAGDERGLREPPATLAALRAARRAFDDAGRALTAFMAATAESRQQRAGRSAS